MIERLHLENFKSHASTDVELGRFTLLVGPNGCGKSSVLQALAIAGRVATPGAVGVFVDASSPDVLLRRGSGSLCVTVTGHAGMDPWRLKFELQPEVSGHPAADSHGARWLVRSWSEVGDEEAPASFAQALARAPMQWRTEDAVPGVAVGVERALRARHLRLDARVLSAPSALAPDATTLEDDGAGLASVVAAMKLEDDASFDALGEALTRIVPAVERLRVKRTSVRTEVRYRERVGDEWKVVRDARDDSGVALRFDFVGAPDIPANAASEGTLLALGILTALHAPGRPKLLLLDDLEHALHPLAQQKLVELIYELLEQKPDLQVVATTHSPYLVDAVRPEDVRVMALDPDGASACRPLMDHPEAERALEVLTCGEFLSSESEEWVLDEAVADAADE